MIWSVKPTIETLNSLSEGNLTSNLGIEFTEIGPDYLIAKMPVDHRTKQPMGLLHGGASVALAETLGSVAAQLTQKDPYSAIVGLEINANHLNSAKDGYVYGKAIPIKVGSRIQVWQIEIKDENEKKICISRLTTMVLQKKKS